MPLQPEDMAGSIRQKDEHLEVLIEIRDCLREIRYLFAAQQQQHSNQGPENITEKLQGLGTAPLDAPDAKIASQGSLPFDPDTVEYCQVAERDGKIIAVQLHLTDGSTTSLNGDQLTDEVLQFVQSKTKPSKG